MADRNAPVKGGQRCGEAGRRVAMDQNPVRFLVIENIAQATEDGTGDMGQVLIITHDIEVVFGDNPKEVEHLVQHIPVLGGNRHLGIDAVRCRQGLDDRRHFDGFGTGSKHTQDFHSRVLPSHRPAVTQSGAEYGGNRKFYVLLITHYYAEPSESICTELFMVHRIFLFAAVAVLVATGLGASGAALAKEPGFVGLQVQGMSPAISQALGLKNADGVLIRDIALGGPADKAGLQRGDLILSFADKEIKTFEGLLTAVRAIGAGERVPITVYRQGKNVGLTLVAGSWPAARRITKGAFATMPQVGLTLAALTPKVSDRFKLRWGSTGVVVTLTDEEKAKETKFQRGDLILQVNQQDVWLPEQIVDAYKAAKINGKKNLLMLVERSSGFRFTLLPVR